jgi:hypothetical protein
MCPKEILRKVNGGLKGFKGAKQDFKVEASELDA